MVFSGLGMGTRGRRSEFRRAFGEEDEMAKRRERKKLQTRRALLNAAKSLFAERGIWATRVEDITERADVAKGAFYSHFRSKDAVVVELVAQGLEVLEENYLHKLEPEKDVSSRIRQLARLHQAFLDEHPQFALLFHQSGGRLRLEHSHVEGLREVFGGYLLRVGRAIASDPHRASWSEEDLVDIAAALVGGISGYRSFRIAAALPSETTAEKILTVGIPELLGKRRDDTG
jgi:AcrR family transcriptional regulator